SVASLVGRFNKLSPPTEGIGTRNGVDQSPSTVPDCWPTTSANGDAAATAAAAPTAQSYGQQSFEPAPSQVPLQAINSLPSSSSSPAFPPTQPQQFFAQPPPPKQQQQQQQQQQWHQVAPGTIFPQQQQTQ
ncbi:unnamed protein product, partial [Sphacelaria rigidula]